MYVQVVGAATSSCVSLTHDVLVSAGYVVSEGGGGK